MAKFLEMVIETGTKIMSRHFPIVRRSIFSSAVNYIS